MFSSLSWASVTKEGAPRSRTAWAVRGPRDDFTCSAEVNSACAKVFATGENACTRKARPAVRGPLMMGAPSFVTDAQLNELNIVCTKKEDEE